MRLRSAEISEVGRVRHRNEDRCLCDDRLGVYGVADGVGGLPGGAEAAQTARDIVLREAEAAGPSGAVDLRRIVEAANAAVIRRGQAISPATGIATTLTVGIFRGTNLHLAHLGDSRGYLCANASLRRLTQDHLAGYALSRCLGHPLSGPADVVELPVQPRDRFLFCTDGLTHSISDEEIAAVLRERGELEDALRELVAIGLARGGIDNLSAVLVEAAE